MTICLTKLLAANASIFLIYKKVLASIGFDTAVRMKHGSMVCHAEIK